MRVFALIVDAVVKNLIIAGKNDMAVWPYVDTDGVPVAIGWGYVDGGFVAPVVVEAEAPDGGEGAMTIPEAMEAVELAVARLKALQGI